MYNERDFEVYHQAFIDTLKRHYDLALYCYTIDEMRQQLLFALMCEGLGEEVMSVRGTEGARFTGR